MKRFLLAVLFLGLSGNAQAQSFELIPDEQRPSVFKTDMRVDAVTGFPVVIYGTDYRTSGGSAEDRAREFLRVRGPEMGIAEQDLALTAVRQTPGGTRVRFRQEVDGVPVFRSDVVISLDQAGRVTFVVNDFKPGLTLGVVASKAGSAAAAAAARDHLRLTESPRMERHQTIVYASSGKARLAHLIEVAPGAQRPGDWEVLVDAETGRVFRAQNRAPGHKGPVDESYNPSTRSEAKTNSGEARRRVDGTGWIFDPDPLSVAQVTYGGNFVDAGDMDAEWLTNALTEVTLRDLTVTDTTNQLVGPYVTIADADAPMDGTFEQDSLDFRFTRGQDSFEAVNAYYHIDKSLRYINETLGFAAMPYQYSAGVLVDPHGANGEDQSYYSSFVGLLSFGEGGVDDAEDADVLLHELGHGIHDWVTNGGLSQVDGLSEGSGDYWANSYHRSLGLWPDGSDEEAWVFHWDGHNEYWNGRTTAYDAHYPDGLVEQIHTDGQMWAAAMMEVWEQLGRETTDLLFLEALSMTGSTTSQSDAAFAVLQADSTLNSAANSAVLLDVFQRRGYLTRADFFATVRAGAPPLQVQFIDRSFSVGAGISAWSWDFDGDGNEDSNSPVGAFTYEEPGLYDVSLTITTAFGQQTVALEDYISVNAGIYVWQGGFGLFDRSGDFLRNHFLSRGLTNVYAGSEVVHSPLAGYDAVFLSLGPFSVFGTPATEMTDFMAQVVVAYVQAGGNVFLDGSEALGFDQSGNAALLGLFGLSDADDGSGSSTPVQNMVGQPGSIMAGMTFTGTQQSETTFIDILTPQSPGVAAFVEQTVGTVGVQHDVAGGGKTFALSYALGQLQDGAAPSTRVELVDRVLTWFGVDIGATDTEASDLPIEFGLDAAYPNPTSQVAILRYRVNASAPVTLSLYNVLGQRVTVLEAGARKGLGVHQASIDVTGLPSGTYIAVLESDGRVDRKPIVVIK